MDADMNSVRASYYAGLLLLGALFFVAIVGAARGSQLIDPVIVRGACVAVAAIALGIVRTDRQYLIKTIPLRILGGVTGCLGLVAFGLGYLHR